MTRRVTLSARAAEMFAPKTCALLEALASRADATGQVGLTRAELAGAAGLDDLGVELAVAVALGRGALSSAVWIDGTDGAVLMARLSLPEPEGATT